MVVLTQALLNLRAVFRERPPRALLKLALLTTVLVLHFGIRLHTHRAMPLNVRHFYPENFACSLSLLSGHGFRGLALPDDANAKPVKEFLRLQRWSVSKEEFDRCMQTAYVSQPATTFDAHRILDVRLVALLWQMFGIRWGVVFWFYIGLSTLTCLLVFLIARRFSGSYWCGLLAAVAFMASPLENYAAIWSFRDTNPLWFTTLGFFVLFCVADRFETLRLNLASFFVLGLCSLVGLGWRYDARLLPPILLLALVAILKSKGRTWKYTGSAAALMLAGVLTTRLVISGLGPPQQNEPAHNSSLHVAYYGEHARTNLLRYENGFQVARNDEMTCWTADEFRAKHHPGLPSANLDQFDPIHSRMCQEMYVQMACYDAYRWVSAFPGFCYMALGGFSTPGVLQGRYLPDLQQERIPWLWPFFCLADLCTAWLPTLFVIGLVSIALLGRKRLEATIMGAYTGYYCLALLAVLPEHKHLPPLLLPLTVIGAMGLWMLLRCVNPRALWREVASQPRRPLLATSAILIALPLVWAGACAIAYKVSARERAAYLGDIRHMARSATPAPETIKDERLFSVRFSPDHAGGAVGYLLKIRSGQSPGALRCRHIRFAVSKATEREMWPWSLAYTTTHRLYPGSPSQYFYVSCHPWGSYGDTRAYVCTVSVSGDAEIVSSEKLDISAWGKLPFSTVFQDDDRLPGAPLLDGAAAATEFFSTPWQQLSEYGLPIEEFTDYPSLLGTGLGIVTPAGPPSVQGGETLPAASTAAAPAELQPAAGDGTLPARWVPAAPDTKVELADDGTRVRTRPGRNVYSACYPPLKAPRDGEYLILLSYTLQCGDIQLGVLSADQSKWLAQARPARTLGGRSQKSLWLRLKANEVFHVIVFNNSPDDNARSECTLHELRCVRIEFKPLLGVAPVATSVVKTGDGSALAGAPAAPDRPFCPQPIAALAFSPSSRYLALTLGTQVHLWDLREGRRAWIRVPDGSYLRTLVFSPDEQVCFCGSDGGMVTVLETQTGRPLRQQKLRHGITCLACPAEGQRLLATTRDGKMLALDTQKGTEPSVLTEHFFGANAVAVSRDGRRALSGAFDQTLKLRDVTGGNPARLLSSGVRGVKAHLGVINSVAVSPDGALGVSAAFVDGGAWLENGPRGDDGIRLWDLDTGKVLRSLWARRGAWRVEVSDDGRRAYFVEAEVWGNESSGRVHEVDIQEWRDTVVFQEPDAPSAGVSSLALSKNGTLAAFGSSKGRLFIWDREKRAVMATLVSGESGWAVGVPDGRMDYTDGFKGIELAGKPGRGATPAAAELLRDVVRPFISASGEVKQ